jgi:hypothetical protein
MPDQTSSNGMQCHEFDGLVSDALDGVLTGVQNSIGFQAHARTCSACGPLLAEVEAGRNWLKDLTEVEPPASLVTNILASTTGVDTQRLRVNVSASQPRRWIWRAQAWAGASLGFGGIPAHLGHGPAAAVCHVVWHGILLAVGGLERTRRKTRRSAFGQLRPTAIRHTYYNTQARVVRYYENIRFVYEVESRVRELKRNVTPAEVLPDMVPENPRRSRKTIRTTQPNSPSRSRSATTARPRTISSWPAPRWVHLSKTSRMSVDSACSVGDHVQEVRMNCATHNDTAAVAFLPQLRQAACARIAPATFAASSTASLVSQPVWKAPRRQPGSCRSATGAA